VKKAQAVKKGASEKSAEKREKRRHKSNALRGIGQACGTEPDYFVEYSGLEPLTSTLPLFYQ